MTTLTADQAPLPTTGICLPKRATAIVSILSENKSINKQNLTAAGRSEYAPLMSNTTAEGKAKKPQD